MKQNRSLRIKILHQLGPTRMLALSFFALILVATILLCMPFVTDAPSQLSFLDNLFIATSVTTVTGIFPVVLSEHYNMIGHTIILILVQVGGLGVMSFIAFAMTVMKRRLYQSEKKMLQDSLSKEDLQDVPKFLKDIVKYTFFFEGLGAILFLFKFIPEYGLFQGIYNSIFLSVSAFCNAGIDNFSLNSLRMYVTDPLINFTVCALVVTGGLGFVVWFDLRKQMGYWMKSHESLKRFIYSLSLHTKIVLIMTTGLIIIGSMLFLLVENHHVLLSYNFLDKLQISIMQSITARTAGFSTIAVKELTDTGLMLMSLLMLIGGSPGGTAGGIKTTALVMLFLGIKAELTSEERMILFKRTIHFSAFQRAFVITLVYIVSLILALFILSMTESFSFMVLVFEAISAITTAGMSMGVTLHFSDLGKIVILILMFIGRVGPITIALSLFRSKIKHKSSEIIYPQSDVLIG